MRNLALFLLEKMATEKIKDEFASCKTATDAEKLMLKYKDLFNIRKKYNELYLTLLATEATTFVESLGEDEDAIKTVFNKYKNSPEESRAREIYFKKYCDLVDEEDKELLPLEGVTLKTFCEDRYHAEQDLNNPRLARRIETIFMSLLLEKGII